MKVLVTGALGFIGFHLIRNLLDSGYMVVGIDNVNDYYNPILKHERLKLINSNNFKFVNCDINNISLADNNFDLAINLAAQAGVRVKEDKKYLYEHTNVNGFKAFCNFCITRNINKIIYASSSSVYSEQQGKFSETSTNLEPKSTYGKSKLLNEEYASEIIKENKISMIGLRFFSVYGPFGRPDMAYFLFTKALKKGIPISLYNKGLMSRDMTYIDDIVSGIVQAIDFIFKRTSEGKNEIFNLGNDKPIKTIELLNHLENKLNKKTEINHLQTQNESFITHADITKAKNLLGYEPLISFNDGIEEFLKWHSKYENI